MKNYMRKIFMCSLICLLVIGAAGTVLANEAPVGTISAKALSSTRIELQWSMNPDAGGYVISRGTTANGSFQKLTSVSGTVTSFQDKTVKSAKIYYYRVTPVSMATGKEMPEAARTAKGRTPQKPQLKNINVKSETRMKIYWDSCSGANGYKIYRSNSQKGKYQLLASLNGRETTSYSDNTVRPGKTYYYKLKATNVINKVAGSSSYSQVIKGKTIARTSITSISSSGSGAMKVSWKKVNGARSYEIYRSTKSSGGFKKIATVKGSSKYFTDKKISAGRKYYYRIQTVGTLNGKKISSGYTAVVSNRTLKQVRISSVKSTSNDGLKVKWSKVTGAEKYKIYRASSQGGKYKKIATVKATKESFQSYTDNKVSSGRKYYYKVQAYSSANGIISAGSGNKSSVKSGSTYYAIMGKTSVTAEQMAKLFKSSGRSYPSGTYKDKGAKNIEKFCQIVIEECEKEGVKAEVVFAQICLETGYLSFGGDVRAYQCNFSGIGATGNGVQGAVFPDVRTGIRAQVQHLKGYASKEELNQACVDPRFIYLSSRRGSTKYVQNLGNGNWAVDPNYASKLMTLIGKMKKY